MKGPIDFEKVKRTRAELEALVKEHPELRHGEGNWANNLEELKEMVTTPGRDRTARYRERQDAAGMKRINCALTPEGAEALEALQTISSGRNVGEVISAALITAALAKVKKEQSEQ